MTRRTSFQSNFSMGDSHYVVTARRGMSGAVFLKRVLIFSKKRLIAFSGADLSRLAPETRAVIVNQIKARF